MEVTMVQVQFCCISYIDIFTNKWVTREIFGWRIDGVNLETGMAQKMKKKNKEGNEKNKKWKDKRKRNVMIILIYF